MDARRTPGPHAPPPRRGGRPPPPRALRPPHAPPLPRNARLPLHFRHLGRRRNRPPARHGDEQPRPASPLLSRPSRPVRKQRLHRRDAEIAELGRGASNPNLTNKETSDHPNKPTLTP